jgi:ABC transport system ATP-binding/permease protein
LLLVSHDRAFLDNVVTSTLVFEGDGQINEYVGGYSDWLQQRKSAASARAGAAGQSAAAAPFTATATSAAAAAAKPRRLSFNEQRELKELPEKIQRLEAEQAQLTAMISDPAAFQRSKDETSAALKRLQALAAELESAYVRWETLESSTRPAAQA